MKALRVIYEPVQPFLPSDIAGLQLWLDVDEAYIIKDGSNYVSQWSDRSGNGNDATQGIGANQPLWIDNQLNSKPIIRFSGNDNLDFTALNMSEMTVFTIYKKTSGSVGTLIADGNTNTASWIGDNSDANIYVIPSSGSYISRGIGGNTNYVMLYIFRSSLNSNGNIEINSIPQSLIYTAFSSIHLSSIGYRQNGSLYLTGDMAEIIIYNSALDDTNRQKVENYLNLKYAIY